MTPLDIFLLVIAALTAATAIGLLVTVAKRGRTAETRGLAIFTVGTAVFMLVGAGLIAYGSLAA